MPLTSRRGQRAERCFRLKSLGLIMRKRTLFRTGRRLRYTLPLLRFHQPRTGRDQKNRKRHKQKGDCKSFHHFLLKSWTPLCRTTQRGSRKIRGKPLFGGLTGTQELYSIAGLNTHTRRYAVFNNVSYRLIFLQGSYF